MVSRRGACLPIVFGMSTLSCSLAFPLDQYAALPLVRPRFVQGAAESNDAMAMSYSASFGDPNTQGNLIVVAASWGGTGTDDVGTTVSDMLGNAYARVTRQWDQANHQGLGIWYAPNVKGGLNAVRIAFNQASGYNRIAIHEYAGIDTAMPLDASAMQLANGAAPTSTAAETQRDNELVFGAVVTTSVNNTITGAGQGFSLRQSVPLLATEDRVLDGAGSIEATFALGTAGQYACQMATFYAAP